MLYCMQKMNMDDPPHVCVGVHLQRSVNRKVKITTSGYITTIQNNCKQMYYFHNMIITIIKTSNSYMFQTLLVNHQGCEHLQQIYKLPQLNMYILSATQILHQEYTAALLHSTDQYIKQLYHSTTVHLDDGSVTSHTRS